MNGSTAIALNVIAPPRVATRFSDRLEISIRAPHGPRLVESKRSKSVSMLGWSNHSHFSSLIHSVTQNSKPIRKRELNMETRALMFRRDGHFDRGLSLSRMRRIAIAARFANAKSRNADSLSQTYCGHFNLLFDFAF